MNRFFVGWVLAVVLGYVGPACAKDDGTSVVGSTDTIIQPFRKASPEAELIYHIMLAEIDSPLAQPERFLLAAQ